ncbi:aromatic alcohol reductase [Telmatospirillum sp.]|uniref:aromatic alcohol reductase n=1 Tax=Telmatospirillum sp. TaxID=2079197 RepID=UPI002840DDC7|nr:aromatic alcohol reductase [Telmatospirillum sp.]MDR3440164.1 aromatic alcohol reductase [Telmatospirillum sp.]
MSNIKSKPDATLVIGAGELGMAMLGALTEPGRSAKGQSLSVLLRPLPTGEASRSQKDLADRLWKMGVEIVRADLAAETEEGLAAIFADFPTVICCTGFVGGSGTQRKITAAVLKARVERYVPWQFGVDYDIVGRGSGQEVFDEQSDVRDMLRAQTRTHWIIVSTGMFTSFLFEPSFGLVDLDHGRVHALGSWENRLTVTIPEDIGRLTTAILAQEPPIDDAVVYVAGDTLSYAQLANTVECFLGRPVERILWSMAKLRSEVAAHPDDGMRKYHLAFARDTGVAWDKERTFNFAQGIPVTDVPTWLEKRASCPSPAAPEAPVAA